ncbi:MAG: hypothetical protein DI603_22305 [Roseateles depolymerans]|uniref:Uncharacterized protein n=1 Tax=Roseateles depolymerans TaxID=76731 RepID=A0A2W5F7V4_9BURK|nr:MAG: hypothetical protein DI603_22305 [Roseateles depolymerans]
MFDGLPLPSFVQVVFGSVLKKNYSIDPVVLSRTDLVTIRTGPQTAAQTLDTTRMLLKTYGLAVTELGGFYRIAPDNNLNAYSPEIRRGRAQPEVPLPLRPVFQLVEMTSVKAVEVSGWLKTMFGQKITIQEDPSRNALLLNGQPADMVAALEALQVLDQPLMRGRRSKLLTPSALSSEDLARKLAEILSTEGYAVSVGSGTQSAISLITIPASNSVLVFTVDESVLQHVISWSQKLEALDNDSRRVGSYFSYTVKYADAQSLAKTLQELLSTPAQTAAPGAIGVTPKAPGRIVVNGATNTLIFTSTQSEYQQLLSILRELDQPSKSALIEVTVAEVRVSDTSQLGIEWALPSGNRVVGGTKGGLGIGTGGLTLNYLSNAGVVKAQLNALAAASKANILSTPRIMARNGETAMIQVGQEVPIVTSQQSNANSGVVGGSNGTVATGILQTIQYKNTGVILKVKPVIFSGDRIELDVSQEVSSAAATSTGVTTSPTISTRKVETKLSIKDGATWLLGGLMSSSDTKTDSGIPLLKDIPIAGQLFRTNTGSVDKTELIVLITPYIINDDNVAEQLTQSFRSQLGGWAQAQPATAQKQSDGRAAATSSPDVGAPNAASPPASQPQAPAVEAPVSAVVAPGTGKGGSSPNEPEAPSKAPEASSVPAASADLGAILSGSNSTPVTDPKLLDEFKRAQSGPAMTEHVVPAGVATVPSNKGAAKPVAKKAKQPVKPGAAASSASR